MILDMQARGDRYSLHFDHSQMQGGQLQILSLQEKSLYSWLFLGILRTA
jgi:hypothetical protein